MSVHAFDERGSSRLESILSRAGAVLVRRGDAPVVANYGSAAGELAACVSAAGLADCSALTKLELTGAGGAVAAVVQRITGSTIAAGGTLHAAGAWWCALDIQRVIVLCDPVVGVRLDGFLHACLAQYPRLKVTDHSGEWAALAVVGRRAGEVLSALGVYGPAGDPRATAPFAIGSAGEVPALWLLESDHHAVALVARAHAGAAWLAIERAGRASDICCVGSDAMSRYALLERRPPV